VSRGARVLAALVIVAAGASYASAGLAHRMLTWDEAEYATIGRSLVRGEGYSIAGVPQPLRPPVLPLSIAASVAVSGRADDAAAVRPIALFAAASLLVVFACVAKATDAATALVATALLAVNLTFCTLATSVLAETPFFLFWTAALWCTYFALHDADGWLYLAWPLFALAWLTRYNAIALGPIVGIYLIAAAAFGIPTRWRALVRSRAFRVAPLVAAVILTPWFVREQLVFGDPLVGVKTAFVQLQVYPAGIEPPTYYLTSLPLLIGWPALACAIVALGAFVRRRDPATLFSLAAAGFVLVQLSRYPTKDARLASSAIPFLLTLAAIGAGRVLVPLLQGGARRNTAWAAAAIPLAVVVAAHALTTTIALRQGIALGYPSFADAMAFVRTRTAASARLLGPNPPQIAWYSERNVQALPPLQADLDGPLASSDWVVVTNFERGQPPYATALLDLVSPSDYASGAAAMFRDGQFVTVLIRTDLLRPRLNGR
jgi:4-amino-4-deoxy-L-arabinose transferase-like glycosyltransferase